MLSATWSIIDVKDRLVNTYDFYSYASDDDFETELETIAEDVVLQYFYPKIGQDAYEDIQIKDKIDLDETETYLYWAEVYTICNEFLKFKEVVSGQLQTSSQETLKVEGYSYSTGGSSNSSPSQFSRRWYRDHMRSYWKLAGYDIMALERTCTIFGTSDSSTIDRTILS
jgi:hypothetical protein